VPVADVRSRDEVEFLAGCRREQAAFERLPTGIVVTPQEGAARRVRLEVYGPETIRVTATEDADLFLVVRVFTPDLKEVTFQGTLDAHTPIAQGWLRASHRKLDKKLSTPYRPYHTHDEKQPLSKGKPVELDVEIWPTSIHVPAGYRIALSVRGKDYEYGGGSGGKLSNFKNELTGCGPFLHNKPEDRPPSTFNGTTTLHFSKARAPYLLLPVIPPKKKR
jgi:predicted acyl esterase